MKKSEEQEHDWPEAVLQRVASVCSLELPGDSKKTILCCLLNQISPMLQALTLISSTFSMKLWKGKKDEVL